MKCPGQDTLYWKPGAIFEVKCPNCSRPVEFFKDDTARKCGHCGHRFVNPKMDFGCAAYCPYAEQCLGTLPEEVRAQKEDLLKDRVAVEMKRIFKRDFKRIGRATRRARYAERIGAKAGGVLPVVLCAAYLWDIGAPQALQKYGDTTDDHLEQESPPLARTILTALQAQDPLVDAVCTIVGHHLAPAADAPPDLKIVYDADWVAQMEDQIKSRPLDDGQLSELIEAELMTAAGKEEARSVLLR
ncbi:MAG: phosphohydrolase [Deltaproteobacteria bacterium]|nr:phosphohydrolase [Deltaproteobacteria bacterium]